MWIPSFKKYIITPDLQKMNIDNIEKYYEIFDRVVDLFPVIKSALEHGDISHELEVFKKQELMFI